MIETWLPPSREHWELINQLWQLFPLVRHLFQFYPVDTGKSNTQHKMAVYFSTMDDRLVPSRQNIKLVPL